MNKDIFANITAKTNAFIENARSDLQQAITGKKPSNDITQKTKSNAWDAGKDTYAIRSEKWYSAKPYGFKIYMRDQNKPITMFLPIGPSNLTITTDFATNMISTLYGTVEEHSDVRYYDIMIEGSTGMAPKYVNPYIGEPGDAANGTVTGGRTTVAKSFSISQNIAGGFFQKTINQINRAVDLAINKPKYESGIVNEESGYVAFHNLYRILLQYKKDASGVTSTTTKSMDWHPITFFNYKDGNEYKVVVRNFTLRRSAENPMLYFYSIQLRGFDLKSVGASKLDEKTANSERLKQLGLDGVQSSSMLSRIKNLAATGKAVMGSIIGGTNILGR